MTVFINGEKNNIILHISLANYFNYLQQQEYLQNISVHIYIDLYILLMQCLEILTSG